MKQSIIMNSVLLIFCLLLSFGHVAAQPSDSGRRDAPGREQIRAAHAAYITERLALTPEESQQFWPVYNEYHEKRRALRQEFRTKRAAGENEKALLELDLRTKQAELDLEKEYTRRLQEIITAEKLIKLRQAEADFRKLIFRQIQKRQRKK